MVVTNVKHFGWRVYYSLIQIKLTTTDQYFEFDNLRYTWNEVLACYKTTFIISLLEKIVIITTDGRYFTIKGSIAEILINNRGDKTATNTGGTAFNELFTQFNDSAIIKSIDKPLQICNTGIFAQTLMYVGLLFMYMFRQGPDPIITVIIITLIVLSAYELYCIMKMNQQASRLCKLNASIIKSENKARYQPGRCT